MKSKKVYFGLLGTLGLLIIAAILMMIGGNKLLAKKSQTLYDKKLENKVLEEQLTALTQAQREMPKYLELEKIAKTIVPQEKDQAKAVREIINIADSTPAYDSRGRVIPQYSQVYISDISFPKSSLGSKPVATSPSGSATSGSSSSSGTTAQPAVPKITQVTPVEGITGVYQMIVTVETNPARPMPYQQLIDFLGKLEKNQRTAQVGSLTITPDKRDPSLVNAKLTISVYVKP